jgi:hypothetical protein
MSAELCASRCAIVDRVLRTEEFVGVETNAMFVSLFDRY